MLELKKRTNELVTSPYVLLHTFTEEQKLREPSLVRAIIESLGGVEVFPISKSEYIMIQNIGMKNEDAVLSFLKGSQKKVVNI